jgi:hypothetical protein
MDAISKHLVGVLRNDKDQTLETSGSEESLIDGHLPTPNDRIYDLVDVVENDEAPGEIGIGEIIVIDGRVYQRVMKPDETVFDLSDVVAEDRQGEMTRQVSEVAERVAREIIPDIVERVIREEIEKLKG